jgi:F-type H+-transporting ATPase subunit b
MTFNWWTFLLQALNFVVLAYVLHRLLYRPLRQAVEERRQASEQAQLQAQKARQDAEALQQQLADQLAQVERQRQDTIHEAREQAAGERRKLLAETEQTVRQRQEEARQTFQRERAEALKVLHTEIVGQAVELTRRLLSESVERSLHQQLVLRLLQTLDPRTGQFMGETDLERLRARWRPSDGVLLETAQALDDACLEKIKAAVTTLLGRPAPLTVQVKPALLAGTRLRLAGQVWDGSLAGQLEGENP